MCKCIFKDLLKDFFWYTLPAFLSNIKLEQLQTKVLKQSHDFSQTDFFLKKNSLLLFKFFIAPLNEFYDLEPMTNVICIFAKYQTGAIADHCI